MENTIDNSNVTELNKIPVMPEKKMKRTRQRLIFYTLIMIFPLLHYAIFKLYINFDMFAMAFSVYEKDLSTGAMVRVPTGFENFEHVLRIMISGISGSGESYPVLLRNSMIFYGIGLTFMPCGICFAYYIYKGYPFGNAFRVFLYLPQILSAVVLTFLHKEIVIKHFELADTYLNFGHLIFYNFITGFGVNVIMYTGAMCGINASISESAQLDGASSFRELWSITIPMIFPTMVTFLVMGIAGIFTGSANLYSFYGSKLSSDLPVRAYQPLGYFMYVNTISVDPLGNQINLDAQNQAFTGYEFMTYPELSALGLLITLFVLPVALMLRRVLEKYGPSDR